MTTIKAQLSSFELEIRYEAAADPVGKSHFHALAERFYGKIRRPFGIPWCRRDASL